MWPPLSRVSVERHCLGETNIIYERFTFNRRDQVENENFDTSLTALREQVWRCEFQGMEDKILRDRIVLWGWWQCSSATIVAEKESDAPELCGYVSR